MANLTKADIDKFTKTELKDMLDEKERQEKERRKKKKLADWLVPFIVIVNIIFTVAVLFVFVRTGSEPSTLIEKWFAFTGVELVAMAGIQVTKVVGEHFGRGDD